MILFTLSTFFTSIFIIFSLLKLLWSFKQRNIIHYSVELNVGDEKSENEKKSKHNLTKTEIIELEKRHHEQQYVKEIMYITDLE